MLALVSAMDLLHHGFKLNTWGVYKGAFIMTSTFTKFLKIGTGIIGVSLIAACTHTPNPTHTTKNTASDIAVMTYQNGKSKTWAAIPDISGMAPVAADTYLVVHDAKGHRPNRPRIGLVKINREKEKLAYTKLSFANPPTPVTSDLEAICRLPGKDEFLITESNYWKGDYGRVFHIKLNGDNVSILKSIQLPDIADDFEGMACAPKANDDVLVILGQRGGKNNSTDINARNGALRFAIYNPMSLAFKMTDKIVPIHAPNVWQDKNLREITGLSIGADNTLWASAAIDLDNDLGPFRSLVYNLGTIYPNAVTPVIETRTHNIWIMDGIKIEAVTAGLDGKSPSYGSEDEKLGGIWRELPKQPTLVRPTTK